MKDFKGKVLVVTGAARGIGKAIAVEGALHGMNVVINDIDPLVKETAKEIEAMGVKCVAQVADATLASTIEELLNITLDNFGKVNIMVSNAGVTLPAPVWEAPVTDLDWITQANFLGHTYGMHYFIKQMIKQGDECAYLNVASGAGNGISGSSCMYHATKTADIVQTECTYLALKTRGISNIQMHVLCPGYILTTIHESDKHRPERYAITDDPYYQSDEFISGQIRAARGVATGINIDAVGMVVFNALEENKFYVFTHPGENVLLQKMRVQAIYDGRHPG